MSSPSVERALELVDTIHAQCCEGLPTARSDSELFAALRSAIRAIPGHEWRKLSEAPKGEQVRLLIENTELERRSGVDAFLDSSGQWVSMRSESSFRPYIKPLAWKPADSTELPAELEGK